MAEDMIKFKPYVEGQKGPYMYALNMFYRQGNRPKIGYFGPIEDEEEIEEDKSKGWIKISDYETGEIYLEVKDNG